jgi:hypothetical protein
VNFHSRMALYDLCATVEAEDEPLGSCAEKCARKRPGPRNALVVV